MPEEMEVPTEELHEHIEHGVEESKQRWILGVALSSAFLAAFAAVAALMAGYHANEAMMDRIKASDQWSFYQAKGIKSAVLETKLDLLKSLKKPVKDEDEAKLKEYKEGQEKISDDAKEFEKDSSDHLRHHEPFSHSVTLFQIAIAVGAIAALTRRKPFWFVSLGFGAVGIVFFILGFLG